jgi:hypothetical protein
MSALEDRIRGALKSRFKDHLEDRVKRALRDCIKGTSNDRSSRYGIFEKFLHRNLLWRANDCQLQKIGYEPPLPSWTWMAYSGGVKFIDVSFGEMECIDSIRFDEDREEAIIANLWVFREGAAKEQIHFDLGEVDKLYDQYCVVVGKTVRKWWHGDNNPSGTEYHILVVVSTGVDGEYRRVGAGTVHCSHVVRQRVGVRVV